MNDERGTNTDRHQPSFIVHPSSFSTEHRQIEPMTKTFYIETWGCQMNDLDSQRLSGSLKLRGYKRVESEGEADLILLNTCSIRDKSEQKVYSHLGRLRELKLERRDLTIGVCGCVAQQEGERLRARAPWVDFVMGPGKVGHLDEVLDASIAFG